MTFPVSLCGSWLTASRCRQRARSAFGGARRPWAPRVRARPESVPRAPRGRHAAVGSCLLIVQGPLLPCSLLSGCSSLFRTQLCFIVWISCSLLLSVWTGGQMDGWTRGPRAVVTSAAVGVSCPFWDRKHEAGALFWPHRKDGSVCARTGPIRTHRQRGPMAVPLFEGGLTSVLSWAPSGRTFVGATVPVSAVTEANVLWRFGWEAPAVSREVPIGAERPRRVPPTTWQCISRAFQDRHVA